MTNNTADDLYPSVAAAVRNGTELVIHAAYQTDGDILVSRNATPLDINNLSCAAFEGTTWAKTQLSQVNNVSCSKPDTAATVTDPANPANNARFAVAWQQYDIPSGSLDDIFVAVDNVGDGSCGVPVNFTNSPAELDSNPSIIMSNGLASGDSLVTVAYLSHSGAPGSPGSIGIQGSQDSGLTFGPAEVLNGTDAASGPPSLVAEFGENRQERNRGYDGHFLLRLKWPRKRYCSIKRPESSPRLGNPSQFSCRMMTTSSPAIDVPPSAAFSLPVIFNTRHSRLTRGGGLIALATA